MGILPMSDTGKMPVPRSMGILPMSRIGGVSDTGKMPVPLHRQDAGVTEEGN